MLYNNGTSEIPATGRTTVTHTGNMIEFERLDIVTPTGTIGFYVGGGALSNDNTVRGFFSATPIPSLTQDCVHFTGRTVARFEGRMVNVTVEYESQRPETCNPRRLVGELGRE